MEEYEYSFKVESIKPYIDYCKKNNFKEISVTKQNRVVYENKNSENIIARLTTKIINNKKEIFFDCKNVGKNDNDLKVSKESLPIKVTKNNQKQIESLLEVLDFYEVANNIRTRYIYEKGNVKFEIDNYESPKMQVVAIEGIKNDVDNIYKDLLIKVDNEKDI